MDCKWPNGLLCTSKAAILEILFSLMSFLPDYSHRRSGNHRKENLRGRARNTRVGQPLWRVIRVKIKCTNFFQFEFRNKSFCVQLLSNCSSFSSLNFETSLFAYNYFLIAALAACSIGNEVYLGITC